MTEEEIQEWKNKIDGMSQTEMASLQRFAPAGHPVFNSTFPLYEYFKEHFKGMTPQISKAIGWRT